VAGADVLKGVGEGHGLGTHEVRRNQRRGSAHASRTVHLRHKGENRALLLIKSMYGLGFNCSPG
jgi:hypothetical protein